jgi:hypothetical protein
MLIFAGGNGGNDFGRVRDSMEGFVFDILIISSGSPCLFQGTHLGHGFLEESKFNIDVMEPLWSENLFE